MNCENKKPSTVSPCKWDQRRDGEKKQRGEEARGQRSDRAKEATGQRSNGAKYTLKVSNCNTATEKVVAVIVVRAQL